MLSLLIFFILSLIICYVSLYNNHREIQLNENYIETTNIKNNEYNSEINNTEQEINQSQNSEELILNHMKLWNLYYNGVPDKYDLNGNRIEGSAPAPKLALYHINQAISKGYEPGYILLAKMYHFGFHDFPENKEEAKGIYTHIINNELPNIEEAIKNFQTIIDEERYSNTSNWLNIPVENIRTSINHGNQYSTINRDEHINHIKKIKQEQKQDRFHEESSFDIQPIKPHNPNLIDIQLENRTNKIPIRNEINNDTQNVHDSSLIRSVKQSIKNLQNSTNLSINLSDSLRNLRSFIQSKPECDRKENSLRTLDSMEKNHEPLVAFELKESDLLHLVWNRINNNHSENKNNLKDNLYDQLANGIEHDKVVCTTGRFTRVLDSLNVLDDQVSIKSRSVINRELMDKSAMIRKEMYDKESSENRKLIDSIQENSKQNEFSEQLKDNIRTQFKRDYIDSNVLTQEELDNEINQWINYI